MIKEFIAVNIDCAAMLSGRSVQAYIARTDAEPNAVAIGTPRNMTSKKIPIKSQLICYKSPSFESAFAFSVSLSPIATIWWNSRKLCNVPIRPNTAPTG